MIQYLIVGAIVLLSVWYLIRKFVLPKKSSSPCSGCDRCGGKSGGCH
ncbi:FeoB-associated Cys-rich membrane protein [Neisseria weaveri]|uniref:Virus attachment protein p12 family n=1 Tax=Neisseria weaveri TaxID=28091 RepID=A0A448VQ14_9NEIS|nr:FeoB-associated Cys-rich membrane protein [Neisseria weaveri]EGV37742.1 hypothetical protein l11_09830 [Neisseria weaveri LMG 5135]SAY50471.1 Virus attachment protein p12 family [Neisseria weaveri]VEJ51880.1 Virus attachment protein p12 family [Neisseria weaveri]